MMTNEQLAEAVARVKELADNYAKNNRNYYNEMQNIGQLACAIIAQQDAIIQQQRDEIEALQAVVFEPCCATEQTIQQQREVMRMAREDFADIAKRGVELFTSHKWLFYCRDIALKQVAALDAALKGSE